MGPTLSHVNTCLTRLGNYRVEAAQRIALEGPPDGISGALLLALGMRESGLQPINNPAGTDRGWCQISDLYHEEFLRSQPGCPVGSWRTVPGHSALDRGYCPRFTPSAVYATDMLQAARAVGLRLKAPDPVRFALAAYNGGIGGAAAGLRVGDVDRYTTGGDYSAWCIAARTRVNQWLGQHPEWRVEA